MKGKGKYFQKRTFTVAERQQAADISKGASLNELKSRRAICQAAVKILEEEKNDPRRADALKHYQDQLAELDRLIAAAERPPDIVIGLQAGVMTAKSEQ